MVSHIQNIPMEILGKATCREAFTKVLGSYTSLPTKMIEKVIGAKEISSTVKSNAIFTINATMIEA